MACITDVHIDLTWTQMTLLTDNSWFNKLRLVYRQPPITRQGHFPKRSKFTKYPFSAGSRHKLFIICSINLTTFYTAWEQLEKSAHIVIAGSFSNIAIGKPAHTYRTGGYQKSQETESSTQHFCWYHLKSIETSVTWDIEKNDFEGYQVLLNAHYVHISLRISTCRA